MVKSHFGQHTVIQSNTSVMLAMANRRNSGQNVAKSISVGFRSKRALLNSSLFGSRAKRTWKENGK